MFKRLHPEKDLVKVYPTCATDTANIRVIDLEIQQFFFSELVGSIVGK